jgi:glycosyltransferase involved in cell wall biosynthesis
MPRPICSVVIPTFNTLDYLPAALASVVAQNLAGVEILVLDDGSSDGTDVWLTENAERIPGLRVFQGGGLGPARARNLLINNAKSNLVAFLDVIHGGIIGHANGGNGPSVSG